MRKMGILVLLGVCTLWLAAGIAMAQSSGNFSMGAYSGACQINSSDGTLSTTGAALCPNANSISGECIELGAPIKVSNGSGIVLLVTPSLVDGLFTQTTINTTVPTATADVGIQVCVTVTDSGGKPVSGVVYGGDSNGCAVYDQRFQQISSGLFSQISECQAITTTQACTVDADCANLNGTPNTGDVYTCVNGFCQGVNTACNFNLILSTLSAHSFNFAVEPPSNGTYTVHAAWTLIGATPSSGKKSSASDTVAACAGPGTLTIMQGKVFNNSGTL